MNVFLKPNLPYLLTIFIGLIAYQINSIVSLQKNSPIISYQFENISLKKIDGNIETELHCTLKNCNSNKAIKNFEIHISYRTQLPNPKKVKNPNIISIAPAAILPDTLTNSAFDLINKYEIPIIQPQNKYILSLKTITNPQIKELPKLYLNSKEDIRLVQNNWEVFIANNLIFINICLLIIWILSVIIYLIYLSYSKPINNEN